MNKRKCNKYQYKELSALNFIEYKYSIDEIINFNKVNQKKYFKFQFSSNTIWANYGIYWEVYHNTEQSYLQFNIPINKIDGSNKIKHKLYNNLLNGEI